MLPATSLTSEEQTSFPQFCVVVGGFCFVLWVGFFVVVCFCLSTNFSLQCLFSLTVCPPYIPSLSQYDNIDSTVRGHTDLKSTLSLDLSDEWATLSAPLCLSPHCCFEVFL